MPKTTDVIAVTVDVYKLSEAIQHYREEVKRGLYQPLLYVAKRKNRNPGGMKYFVCRIPSGLDDAAFVIAAKRQARQYQRVSVFVKTVLRKELFVIEGEQIVPWSGV